MQQRRDAAQRRQRDHRPRAVAADADHHRRTPTRDHAATRRGALDGSSASAARAATAATCPSVPRCESRPARSLRAARRAPRCPAAVPTNVTCASGHARQQLPRHRDARIQMPARSAAGDQRRACSGHPSCLGDSCCEMFSSTPMPSRLISSDDPPELTSGSGMPFVGSKPEHDADVDERLHGDHRGQTEREERAEGVLRAQRDAQAAPGDDAEADENESSRRSGRAPRRSPRR